jgi:hypothetical protein
MLLHRGRAAFFEYALLICRTFFVIKMENTNPASEQRLPSIEIRSS